MATYVGRWDCNACGTQAILGPETRCPNCGASRPKDVQFYLPEDAERLRDKEQIKQSKAGADWICGHCTTQNKTWEDHCHGCGNPRDEQSQDVVIAEKTYDPEAVPRSGRRERQAMASPAPRRKSKALRYLLIAAGLLIGFFVISQIPSSTEVTLVGFQWERQVQMEHYEPVQKEDWSTPSGAYDISSFRAIHHYDKVFQGYETRYRDVQEKVGEERYVCGKVDKGNGYFEDKYCTRSIYETRQESYQAEVYNDVPVYRQKYRYTIKEWTARQSYILRAEGLNQQVRWPSKSYPDAENWREGDRTGKYLIKIREEDGTEHMEDIPESSWLKLSSGQKLAASKSFLFGTYFGLDREALP